MKTVSLFGHGLLFNKKLVSQRLFNLLKEIVPQGFTNFLIGCHGDFDNISLTECKRYKEKVDENVNVCVVLTSLSYLSRQKCDYSLADLYDFENCQTVFYDIEDKHYKNRITYSNKKMIDNSDLIICYVDMKSYKSGAKNAIKYAIKNNKKIINLYSEDDKI